MKTITSANANRDFSKLLKEVRMGEDVTILSRGTPVAKITSISSDAMRKGAMKKLLLSRLKSQSVTGVRNWTREDLYSE
jgi:prevent-host-death family protein